jgi:hypothetical protein
LRSLFETSDAFRAEKDIVRAPHPLCGSGFPPSYFWLFGHMKGVLVEKRTFLMAFKLFWWDSDV